MCVCVYIYIYIYIYIYMGISRLIIIQKAWCRRSPRRNNSFLGIFVMRLRVTHNKPCEKQTKSNPWMDEEMKTWATRMRTFIQHARMRTHVQSVVYNKKSPTRLHCYFIEYLIYPGSRIFFHIQVIYL